MKKTLCDEVNGRLRLALLVIVLAFALCPTVHAAIIYESAPLGAKGVTGPFATIMYDQWFGVRFQVAEPMVVKKIGGHFVAGIPGSAVPARTFFGAVVQLTGLTDFPDTKPVFVIDIDPVKYYSWTGADILARVDMVAPNTSADIRADLPGGGIVLQPGYYALIFGALASNSRVGMITTGTDTGTVSDFAWIAWSEISPGSPFPDDWYDGYRPAGTRFVVEGKPWSPGAAPIAVQLACPVSVNVGQPLTVTVNLYNRDCYDPASVNRFMMSVIGNADGTLGGLGMFGPYNRWLSTPRVVPPADCGTIMAPGTATPFNLTAIVAVPASLSGKMATVDIEAVTNKGQTLGGGECVVNVLQ
ncbi:MAG: hypothetical protein OEW04_00890 [Nitrospirota bacterium]|nr:hypothetical protein [Nitrospirota bacterium]